MRVGDFDLKQYGIASGPDYDIDKFTGCIDLARAALPPPNVTEGRLGVGFTIADQGKGADYFVTAWWDRQNELPLRVFVRDEALSSWRPAQAGESVCVWDLEVIYFERNCWVATALSGSDALTATREYLRQTFRAGQS